MGGPSSFWPGSLRDEEPLHAPKEAVTEAIFDNCFLAGTLVVSGQRQADGTIERALKPIESMQPDDPVWSEDPTTGWRGWGVVKQTFSNETDHVAYLVHRPLKQQGRSEGHRVGISEEDGEPPSEEPAPAQLIRCTPGHPWWSEDRQTFAHTATFRDGERLRLEDGSLSVVVSLVVKAERARTFNFEVARGAHTYFVAERADQPAVLVHNKSRKLGAIGEALARRYYKSRGYEILGSIQNKSGHGLDLVLRNRAGNLVFAEIKTTAGRYAPAMSKAQRKGGDWFVQNRLGRAVAGKGHWSHVRGAPGSVPIRAQDLLDEVRASGALFETMSIRLGRAPGDRIVRQMW